MDEAREKMKKGEEGRVKNVRKGGHGTRERGKKWVLHGGRMVRRRGRDKK